MPELTFKSKRVTLTDIAKAFGVSVVTASKAVNSQPGVSPIKAEAIRRYAKDVGYAPSYAARSLVKGRTNLVGICLRGGAVLEPWANPWLFMLLAEMERRFSLRGFRVQVSMATGGIDDERAAFERFAEFGVEAAIVGPMGAVEEYNALAEQIQGLRYVLAFDATDDLPIDHVRHDTYRGGQLAAEYLYSAGHRHAAVAGASRRELEHKQRRGRLNGFLDAAERLGLQVQDSWITPYDEFLQHPDSVADVIRGSGSPTAFFCHNDWVAGVVIRALWKRGLRVPEDVSVLGFDNQPVAQITTPAISSVAFELGAYVEKMVSSVVHNISEQHESVQTGEKNILRWSLAPTMVVRESVKQVV